MVPLKLPDWAGLGEGLALGDGDGDAEGEDGGAGSAHILTSRLPGACEAWVATAKTINATGLVVAMRVLTMFFIRLISFSRGCRGRSPVFRDQARGTVMVK